MARRLLPLYTMSDVSCRAPEFKFPYAVDDCFDVLKWVGFVFHKDTYDESVDEIAVQSEPRILGY